MNLVKVIYNTHKVGIKLNTKFAEEQFSHHKKEYDRLKEMLFKIVGPFNTNVTSTQIEKLFEDFGLKKEYTIKKEFKTSDDVLSKYSDTLAVFKYIKEIRFHYKMFRSFLLPASLLQKSSLRSREND